MAQNNTHVALLIIAIVLAVLIFPIFTDEESYRMFLDAVELQPVFCQITNGTIIAVCDNSNDTLTMTGGSGILIDVDGGTDTVTITSTASGAGEANTASNVGTGVGLFRSKLGVDLTFHSLLAGQNIIISDIGDEVRINATGGGGATVNNQTVANDFQIVGINNVTGVITTNQFSVNSITCTGSDKVSAIDNATGDVTCGAVAGGGNVTNSDDLGDYVVTSPAYRHMMTYDGLQWINKAFSINNQTVQNDFQIVGINNETGIITTNQFSVNNQTVANDFQIVGINNQTGDITTNQFSVNTINQVCSGTDKVSTFAFNNVTGDVTVTCTTDVSGGGSGIPLPSDKKFGLITPAIDAQLGTSLLQGSVFDGTETKGDDTDGGRISTTTGTTVGGDAGTRGASMLNYHREWDAYMDARVQLQGTGGYETFIGFNSDTATGALAGTNTACNSDSCAGIGLRGNTHTTWQYIVNDGDATADFTNSGIANNTSVVRLQIEFKSATSEVCFTIDANPQVCLTIEIPASTTDLGHITSIATTDIVSDTFEYYYVYTTSTK